MSDDFASDGGGAGDDGGDLNVDTGGDSSGGAGTDFGGDLANDVGNASSGDAGADFGSDIASDAGADLNDDPDSNAETDLMGTGSADDLSAGADANAPRVHSAQMRAGATPTFIIGATIPVEERRP